MLARAPPLWRDTTLSDLDDHRTGVDPSCWRRRHEPHVTSPQARGVPVQHYGEAPGAIRSVIIPQEAKTLTSTGRLAVKPMAKRITEPNRGQCEAGPRCAVVFMKAHHDSAAETNTMYSTLVYALIECSATLLVTVVPILCHSVKGWIGNEPQGSWAVEVLMVAIATSGLSTVTLVARLAKGEMSQAGLRPWGVLLLALSLVAFLMSGVLYGQADHA